MVTRTKETRAEVWSDKELEALVEQRMTANRDSIRQQVIRDAVAELVREASKQDATLDELVSQLKGAGKEVWKYASSRPTREIMELAAGVDRLKEQNQKLRARRRRLRPRWRVADLVATKNRILSYLKASKEKPTIGELQSGLSLDSETLKRPLLELRKSGQIATSGHRRSMRYSIA